MGWNRPRVYAHVCACVHALGNVHETVMLGLKEPVSRPTEILLGGQRGCKETHAQKLLGATMLPCTKDEGLITGAMTTAANAVTHHALLPNLTCFLRPLPVCSAAAPSRTLLLSPVPLYRLLLLS